VRVVAALVGLPDEDSDRILGWTDDIEKIGDDAPLDELRAIGTEFSKMQGYILDHYHEKQRATVPGTDMLSVLAELGKTDQSLGEANIMMLSMLIVAAAGGTTRAMLLALTMHLARHPEQVQLLRDDRTLVSGAVEEALRYVPPVRAFLRTALRDTEVGLTWLTHEYRGHLRVTEDGDLLYLFPNGFTKPWETREAAFRLFRRVARALAGAGRFILRAWLLIAMVVAFVAGLIAVSRFEKEE